MQKIGTWSLRGEKGFLHLNGAEIKQEPLYDDETGGTRCFPKCVQGEKEILFQKVGVYGDDICFSCRDLQDNEILSSGHNVPCDQGYWPNTNQTECIKIWSNNSMIPNYDTSCPPVVWVDIISVLCSVIIIGYSVIFFINRDKDIVGKSGRHYLPFLFGGAFLCQVCSASVSSSTMIISFLIPGVRIHLSQHQAQQQQLHSSGDSEWSQSKLDVRRHPGED